ncbi:MAG TPA: hypothetical protein VJ124_17645 [Pyrinomonadaceae bacterium]|nr:hypothetical protein [Pyrinomonadaceae bacterium]
MNITKEVKLADTNRQTAVKESKMKITASNVIRWSGLAAMGSGIIFIAIQPIHPLDILSSVTTSAWAIVQSLKFTMAILGLLGIAGLYARQVEKAGWLGLAAYLLFSLFYALTAALVFAEAFILPLLATEAPKFVEGFLGMITGAPSEVSLGALPAVYALAGLAGYLLGGLLFGIATFRAAILPRWAGGLLAFGVLLPILTSSLIPHPFDRILAVPMGLALVWLGYALWSERREQAS